ncbi:MAG: PRC-barrel domain-containing protein [Thermoleophilia bacterium]
MARIDTDLLGLQIVALDSAMVVGEIDGLLIDDAAVRVAGFLVDLGLYEASVLPFESVGAVGLDAVIVESAAKITPISTAPALEALAEKDVTISDAKAITRSGRSVGTIGDFFVDTETGDVVGMEFIAADQTVYPREAAVIPTSSLYRLGRDIAVLEDDYDKHLMKDDASLERVSKPRPARVAPVVTPEPEPEPAPQPAPQPVQEAAPIEPIAAQSTALEAEEPEPAKQIEDAFQAITIADVPEMPLEPEAIEEPDAEEPADAAVAAEEVAEEPADAAVAEAPEEAEVAVEEPEAEIAEIAEPAAEEVDEAAEDEDAAVDDTLTSAPALDLAEPAVEEPTMVPVTPEPADDAFTSQQKHFLIGKRVLRRIETPGGEVIAEEGELVTFEMIQKAKSSDQLLILSLNVE